MSSCLGREVACRGNEFATDVRLLFEVLMLGVLSRLRRVAADLNVGGGRGEGMPHPNCSANVRRPTRWRR